MHWRRKSTALSHNTLSLIDRTLPDLAPYLSHFFVAIFVYIRERPVQSRILVLPVGLVHIYHCINDRDPVSEVSASCLFSARPALWCNKYVNIKTHTRRLIATALRHVFFFSTASSAGDLKPIRRHLFHDILYTHYSILYTHLSICEDEH
jgi:hypothetical protein